MKGMTVSMTESADDHDGCEGGAWARLTVEVEMSMRVSGLESNHFCNCEGTSSSTLEDQVGTQKVPITMNAYFKVTSSILKLQFRGWWLNS